MAQAGAGSTFGPACAGRWKGVLSCSLTLGSNTCPGTLTCLSVPQHNSFWVGDVVRVIDDLDTVKRLQAGHGEWTDDMAPVSPPSPPSPPPPGGCL